jgi:hypothetical protein
LLGTCEVHCHRSESLGKGCHKLIRVLATLDEDDCHALCESQEVAHLVGTWCLKQSLDHTVQGIEEILLLHVECRACPHVNDLEGAQKSTKHVLYVALTLLYDLVFVIIGILVQRHFEVLSQDIDKIPNDLNVYVLSEAR